MAGRRGGGPEVHTPRIHSHDDTSFHTPLPTYNTCSYTNNYVIVSLYRYMGSPHSQRPSPNPASGRSPWPPPDQPPKAKRSRRWGGKGGKGKRSAEGGAGGGGEGGGRGDNHTYLQLIQELGALGIVRSLALKLALEGLELGSHPRHVAQLGGTRLARTAWHSALSSPCGRSIAK